MSNLEELAGRVVRDLSVGVEATPSITFSDPDEAGYVGVRIQDQAGMFMGFAVNPSAPAEEILYEMAYRIPDAYVELYAVGLPLVPGTERPANPTIIAGEVFWEDPSESGTWSCLVGAYG